jgi:hypothetical protein
LTCAASMSRDSPAPGGARRSSRDVIEAQITFPHFRQKDDLTCVHREVFDDCVDGSHHRHVVTLDASMFEQSRRIDVREHAIPLQHGCAKLAQELSLIGIRRVHVRYVVTNSCRVSQSAVFAARRGWADDARPSLQRRGAPSTCPVLA